MATQHCTNAIPADTVFIQMDTLGALQFKTPKTTFLRGNFPQRKFEQKTRCFDGILTFFSHKKSEGAFIREEVFIRLQ